MLSGILALIILSGISLVYYNPPVTIPQSEGYTKNRFMPNKAWSTMGEGFGYGVTDNLGYNSVYYNNCENPDIVVIGSSHMEAVNVPSDKNCTYVLNKNFAEDDRNDNDFKCLNIGRAGSFFDQSVSYFETVAEKFTDAKYLVVETKSLGWTIEQLDGMLNQQYRQQTHERSFVGNLTVTVPYFRIFFKQMGELASRGNEVEPLPLVSDQNTEEYAEKMNAVIAMIASQAREHGKELIILHHNTFSYEEMQNAKSDDDPEQMKVLEQACMNNNVVLVDVTDEFISHYKNTYELPYGFSNSQIGEGHLNALGHKIIADELYKAINQLSDANK